MSTSSLFIIEISPNRVFHTGKKYNTADQIVYSHLRKHGQLKYEYEVEDQWKPDRKGVIGPCPQRIVFEGQTSFFTSHDISNAWHYILSLREGESRLKISKPTNSHEVIRRFISARETGNPLILFTPWGPRPVKEHGLETDVLDRITVVSESLKQFNIPVQPLIMPADLYATEINNKLDPEQVANYFSFIKEEAQKRGFTVQPWSQIRSENQQVYGDLSLELSTEDDIKDALFHALYDNDARTRLSLDPVGRAKEKIEKVVNEAIGQATRRSGYTDSKDIRTAAFKYLRERLIEAIIVNEAYRPVKLSAVGRNKDIFDGNYLPTIYVLPEKMQFPWLKDINGNFAKDEEI